MGTKHEKPRPDLSSGTMPRRWLVWLRLVPHHAPVDATGLPRIGRRYSGMGAERLHDRGGGECYAACFAESLILSR